MDKRFWAIIGVIILIFGGVVFFNSRSNGTNSSGTSGATNHVRGNLDSKVTLEEYGDYQCPACGEFYTATHQVYENYKDKVKFQFRNLPLSSIHPNAFAGARAAEAADMQGKFWEMHDLLYENQDTSGQSGWVASKDPLSAYFTGFAQQLSLNVDQFKKDYASSAANSRINADIDAFKKTGEQMSTPTFFINGKLISNGDLLDATGRPSADAFGKLLDKALAEQ